MSDVVVAFNELFLSAASVIFEFVDVMRRAYSGGFAAYRIR